ncbi:NAD(P)/FAD-dependent oxidoreductase [Brevibacillus marinus]|uniref:NAD(P)/FAD-dependent oxidoreductase n=1 Tax=Brevibacillus marinus TaxID=2496837 RepID=UPI000F83CE62|nr:FAD-dependent oxidoreductase [Brevibacillus marinus]
MRIVVVGAGIVGMSTAYHLAKQGVEVAVVDKFHQGQATAAGAGIVCPWISKVADEDWYKLANAGACYYPTLLSQLEDDGETNVGYRQVGALAVSSDQQELEGIEQKARKLQTETPAVGEVTRLSAEAARRLFPLLREDLAAVYVSGAARLDGNLLRDALQRVASKHGATFHAGEARLAVERGKAVGVQVNGERLAADAVVVTGGAWASALLAPYGIDLCIQPQRGQIVHLQLPGRDTANWPVILPPSTHYLVSFDDSRVVAGATRETGSGFDYRITAGGIKEVLEEAISVAPGLSEGTVHEIRIGFRPMGPDHLPLLGTVPAIDNLIIATGLGASGLTMGPYVGTIAAKLALDEALEIDLRPYDPLRKQEG